MTDGVLALRPWAVDVSSGVERAKGIKDAALMRRFCAAVREADARIAERFGRPYQDSHVELRAARRPRAFRPLWRQLRRRNADARARRTRAAYAHYRHDAEFLAEFRHELAHFVGRPSPVYHAARLSRELGGAQIHLKREDLNHTGAHKVNNTIGQALLARRMGKPRVIAETGAGQHGVATATICARYGIECRYAHAVDAGDRRLHQREHDSNVMNHQVEHNADLRSARLIRRQSFRRDIARLIDFLFEETHHRVEMLDVPDLHDPVARLRRGQHPLRFLEGSTKRLLDQQMRAARQQRERDVRVLVGGHDHRHRIARRAQLSEGGEPTAIVLCANFRGPSLVRLVNSDELRPGKEA